MLLSLIETKEFCEEQAKNFRKGKLALSAHQWDAIENIYKYILQLHSCIDAGKGNREF